MVQACDFFTECTDLICYWVLKAGLLLIKLFCDEIFERGNYNGSAGELDPDAILAKRLPHLRACFGGTRHISYHKLRIDRIRAFNDPKEFWLLETYFASKRVGLRRFENPTEHQRLVS